MQIENTLISAGLSRSESKVYCALAGIGPANVTKLAKETGMYRANVYESASKLVSKGFISKVEVEKTTFFEAEDPDLILEWSSKKIEELRSVVPSLKLVKELKESKNPASIIEGSANLYKELKDMADTDEEIRIIGNPKEFSSHFAYIIPGFVEACKTNDRKVIILKPRITKEMKAFIAIGDNKVIFALEADPMKIIRITDRGLCNVLKDIYC